MHTIDVDPARRLVLVPVGGLDRRAAESIGYARTIPARERRALHVVTDDAAANALAHDWMTHGLGFPLVFADDSGGIPATVARVVTLELLGGCTEVVMVAGRLALRRRVHRLLHDRTADAIARAVASIPDVSIGLLDVART